jgi:hypothetical protein
MCKHTRKLRGEVILAKRKTHLRQTFRPVLLRCSDSGGAFDRPHFARILSINPNYNLGNSISSRSSAMNRMYEQDWDGALAVASKDDLSAVARAAIEFDWDSGDMRVLGRLMSKVGLDLATAVQVFLNGRPQDFNHMAKEDVPLRDSARFSMLECLYRKICCGFYLPNPEIGLAPVRAEAQGWIDAQRRDCARGTQGRWVFDERKFEAISDNGLRTIVMTPQKDSRPAFLRMLMEPLWG